jgi:hypothetical protein
VFPARYELNSYIVFRKRLSLQKVNAKSYRERSVTGAGIRRILRFPLPSIIPQIAANSCSSSIGWYSGPTISRHMTCGVSHLTPRV